MRHHNFEKITEEQCNKESRVLVEIVHYFFSSALHFAVAFILLGNLNYINRNACQMNDLQGTIKKTTKCNWRDK